MTTTIPPVPATITLASLRAFYEAIPDSLWCLYRYRNDAGQRCAAGFLLPEWFWWPESDALTAADQLFAPLAATLPERVSVRLSDDTTEEIARDDARVLGLINNGEHPSYQQATPRLRVLTAIDDLMVMRGGEVS